MFKCDSNTAVSISQTTGKLIRHVRPDQVLRQRNREKGQQQKLEENDRDGRRAERSRRLRSTFYTESMQDVNMAIPDTIYSNFQSGGSTSKSRDRPDVFVALDHDRHPSPGASGPPFNAIKHT